MSLTLAAAALCLAATPISADDDWTIQRVGGNLEAQTVLRDGVYRFQDSLVEESLPVGYPAPTPPGAIELKKYPTVRRAEFSGQAAPDLGSNVAFFPLFNHIKGREIAMTSPVEMDLPDATAADASSSPWTMSFLYRSADLGPTGKDGRIVIRDAEPMTVISIGLSGAYGSATVRRGLDRLDTWFAEQNQWERAGTPRALYYNGPYIPSARKWAEVQVPVRRVNDNVAAASGTRSILDRLVTTPAPTRLTPPQLIELAVERGAPLYNDDQPGACAAVYEITVQSLLTMGACGDDVAVELRDAADAASQQHDSRERAWILRRALESAYASLTEEVAAAARQ